jgi:hypothetical protein
MSGMIRPAVVGLAALAALAGAAHGQGLCPEFQVSTATINQAYPAVASAANGDFVVVWIMGDTSGVDVLGRRFDSSGGPRGPEFRVNTATGFHTEPAVAADPSGNTVVVWKYADPDGPTRALLGRRYDSTGAAQGGEFQVATFGYYFQARPAVATASGGEFVVVWTSYAGGGSEIFGRRYDAAGAPQGPEFQVNTYTTGFQRLPAVSVDTTGAFVVLWEDSEQSKALAQRFDAGGARVGSEIEIQTVLSPSHPKLAHGPNNDFLVVWGGNAAMIGRRFDASGVPQGAEFPIALYTATGAGQHDLAGDPGGAYGSYVAVWSAVGGAGDPEGGGIFGRRLDALGAPLGPEFLVNTFTEGTQRRPAVARGPGGGFVAVWDHGAGIFGSVDCATRFFTVAPCRVADTRSTGPPLAANSTRSFPIAGACGIPADARAVALNATAVNPTDLGNLRVYPTGQTAPLASTLNFVPGRSRANNAVAALGAGGAVAVQCDMPAGSTGTTHLVLDVYGYFER